MKRKICVVTGTRADYGIFYPVMKAIKSSPDLSLHIVVTGMHLMREFGFTADEIKKDGFTINDKVDISCREDSSAGMAGSTGKAMIGFSEVFARSGADIVLILGDRGEMLSASIAANFLNIPVAHIHGGEISGNVDDIFRHAITKLSHIHFPASRGAMERILRLGEDQKRVFLCGAPALDRILNEEMPGKEYIFNKFGIHPDEPFFLIVQHPVSTETDQAAKQMKMTLDAVRSFKTRMIVLYPNSDAGGRSMINVIKKYAGDNSVKIFKSISHKDYLGLLRNATALVGNSSSGIIEAPSLKVPVINIGIRQDGRERSSNIIDVPHSRTAIIKAISKVIKDKAFRARVRRCRNIYGDGHAGERIVKVLGNIKIDNILLQKKITY